MLTMGCCGVCSRGLTAIRGCFLTQAQQQDSGGSPSLVAACPGERVCLCCGLIEVQCIIVTVFALPAQRLLRLACVRACVWGWPLTLYLLQLQTLRLSCHTCLSVQTINCAAAPITADEVNTKSGGCRQQLSCHWA